MEEQVAEKMATILVEPLPTLKVSPVLMRPLFQNLIKNALYYTRENVNPVVKIRSEIGALAGVNSKTPGSNGYCHIMVEDNGVGFDQANADKIFNHVEQSQKNGELKKIIHGLALCKKIMEKHGGFILAESKIDEGSTFTVSFPVAT